MNRLLKRFPRARTMDTDCYVADYSQATASHMGVSISDTPFSDIESFRLLNSRHNPVRYIAINLEQHKEFIRGIENCECFFASTSPLPGAWILFLELKYCRSRNLGHHSSKAVSQMASVLRKLIAQRLIDPGRHRIYFNYSSPANSRRQPFTHFLNTQSDALQLIHESNAIFMGFNKLIIASPNTIRAPKTRL